MKRRIIIAILAIVLIGVLLAFYFNFDFNFDFFNNDTYLINISIAALYDDDFISTQYYVSNIQQKQKYTLLGGYVQERIPFNTTTKIYNVNLEHQNFYTDVNEVKFDDDKTHRIYLQLSKPDILKVVNINDTGELINIELKSNNYKKIRYCLRWSPNVITVKDVAFQAKNDDMKTIDLIDVPDKLRTYMRCYHTHQTLNNKNDTLILKVYYESTFDFNSQDYIYLYAYDGNDIEPIENELLDKYGENLEIKIK